MHINPFLLLPLRGRVNSPSLNVGFLTCFLEIKLSRGDDMKLGSLEFYIIKRTVASSSVAYALLDYFL